MYDTLKRVYKNSYNATTGLYNEFILTRAVEKGWIDATQKAMIIEEVANET